MMTKRELNDYINSLIDKGYSRKGVAELLKCDISIVNRAMEARKYGRVLAVTMIEWDSVVGPIRKELKRRRKQKKRIAAKEDRRQDAVYCRVNSWSGYWWVPGYGYDGTARRQQEG